MSAFPVYTKPERLLDAVVHLIGVSGAIGGLVTLIVLAALGLDLISVVAVMVYGVGLVLTFALSAAYNLVQHPGAKGWLRRFDHAAIFVMIAGTYTPFALVKLPPESGYWLLGLVWSVAFVGVLLKLFLPGRFERSSVLLYLLQGWAIVWLLDTLVGSLATAPLVLLAVGGGLYTLGVVFHLWEKLPYQNAIWHLFVLFAASCHFAAILVSVA